MKLRPGFSWEKEDKFQKEADFILKENVTKILGGNLKGYIWSTALCGDEIWTLWKVGQK